MAASRPHVPVSSGEGICVPKMSACANATGSGTWLRIVLVPLNALFG
jgi:hypothetical protein